MSVFMDMYDLGLFFWLDLQCCSSLPTCPLPGSRLHAEQRDSLSFGLDLQVSPDLWCRTSLLPPHNERPQPVYGDEGNEWVWLLKSPIDCLILWIFLLFDQWIDWLIQCAIDWLIDWLIDWVRDWTYWYFLEYSVIPFVRLIDLNGYYRPNEICFLFRSSQFPYRPYLWTARPIWNCEEVLRAGEEGHPNKSLSLKKLIVSEE